jgi:hypothetical protein
MGSGSKKAKPLPPQEIIQTPVTTTSELQQDKAISRVASDRVEGNASPSLLDDDNEPDKTPPAVNLLG